jgi:hypothetical protein
MTPKEKAKELVDKFTQINGHSFFAKECALVVAHEIYYFPLNAKCESQFVVERYLEKYWQEVKQEIDNL